MGQNSSHSFRQNYKQNIQELEFYTTVENDRQFGEVQVYISTKRPCVFVAKVQQYDCHQNSQILNRMEEIENHQAPFLISLNAFQVERTKYFSSKETQKIVMYWEYYNYYLKDHLSNVGHNRCRISEKELWYLIKICCQSWSVFERYGMVLDLEADRLVLNPEGNLKVYWHHLQYQNRHLRFFKEIQKWHSGSAHQRRKQSKLNFCNKDSLVKDKYSAQKLQNQNPPIENNFLWSPEQLLMIRNRQAYHSIDFAKANSWRLGMLIIYCITLVNPIQSCYNLTNYDIKHLVLRSIYEQQVLESKRFSVDLKHLIKLLLEENSSNRIPINCIFQVYENLMPESGEFEIVGGPEDPSSLRRKKTHESVGHVSEHKSSLKGGVENHYNQNQNQDQDHYRQFHQQIHEKKSLNRSEDKSQRQLSSSNGIKGHRIQRSQSSLIDDREHFDRGSQYKEYDKYDTKTIKISNNNSKHQI